MKKENPVVVYFRKTWAELKRVNWPTMDQGVAMTKIVLIVTTGMALFLGALDFFFGWMLSGVVGRDPLFLILGVVVVLALVGATYLIGRGEGD
ncbi:MAG: preprotein translocase subunit SecE [Anaerolineae bacterium]|nr:preprotein translocase subunit SecE [Anaerolineae bacterium]